jgi:hypothetical protein
MPNFLIHLFSDRCSGWFITWLLLIAVGVPVSSLHADFDSFQLIPEVVCRIIIKTNLVLWRTSILISLEWTKVSSHQQCMYEFPFPCILTSIFFFTCLLVFLMIAILIGYNGISKHFWFAFPLWLKMLNFNFSYNCGYLYFGELSFQFICSFFNWISCSLMFYFYLSLYFRY